MRNLARAELIRRAKDVSTTVGTTIRLLRRFGGVVSKERLESALTELLRPGEWDGIELMNEAGDVVASVGTPMERMPTDAGHASELWGKDTVALINPVALGTNVTRDLEGTNLPVIVDFRRPPETNRPPFNADAPPEMASGGPKPDGPDGPPPMRDSDRRRRGGGPRFTRPPWWSEEEWKAILEKQGVHSFAVVMSTGNYREANLRDLWLRAMIITLAGVSVAGMAFAWGNLVKSSNLQLRLVRASELNTHLREMNLAAAGLAHETRNPLNIIRGMAQMITKNTGTPPEIHDKSRAIVDEVDKVTAQLNEFINYSRPREIRPSAVGLHAAINEVARALSYDIEEKKIRFELKGESLSIEADEQMLRQVLFNLVLNAIQALPEGGEIQVVAQRGGDSEATLEIRDNGPGIPLEQRREIFKPYFTTQQKGTGLGLAIVQQIVLAHGWEVECLSNHPKGAVFRLTHLKAR